MANGGGTSQALSGAGCEVLVAALREIGATEMIAPIIRLDQSIRAFEKQNSDLDWQALVEEASAMKRGPWRHDDQVLIEPEDRIPRLLIGSALRHEARICIAGFEF